LTAEIVPDPADKEGANQDEKPSQFSHSSLDRVVMDERLEISCA
jgi:hypothetical protein